MSRQSHAFSVEYAELYGVECAILIQHFQFWIEQNQRLGRNFHDGRTWTYQTQNEICAIYRYWNRDKVQGILEKLVELGVIIKGNYNKSKLDRTQWYAFKNENIFTKVPNSTIEKEKQHNGLCQTAPCIPDTKTNTKTNTPKGDISRTAKKLPRYEISFSFEEGKFQNIKNEDIDSWKSLYPSVDIISELRMMVEWIKSNEKKAKSKSLWRKFINNWLKSSNEKSINKEALWKKPNHFKQNQYSNNRTNSDSQVCREPLLEPGTSGHILAKLDQELKAKRKSQSL